MWMIPVIIAALFAFVFQYEDAAQSVELWAKGYEEGNQLDGSIVCWLFHTKKPSFTQFMVYAAVEQIVLWSLTFLLAMGDTTIAASVGAASMTVMGLRHLQGWRHGKIIMKSLKK